MTDLNRGIHRDTADIGLVSSGTTTISGTTVIFTDNILPNFHDPHQDSYYLLIIDKPTSNVAASGDLEVKTYNVSTVNDIDERNSLHTTHTVELTSGTTTTRDFLVQGLFIGDGKIKLSFNMIEGTTTGINPETFAVGHKLFRL